MVENCVEKLHKASDNHPKLAIESPMNFLHIHHIKNKLICQNHSSITFIKTNNESFTQPIFDRRNINSIN